MGGQKETLKDRVQRYTESNKNPDIDSVSIVNLGSIGSGKTTLVSRVHNLLGYYKPGFKIESGIHPIPTLCWGSVTRRVLKGVGFRKGATAALDSTIIYGYTPDGIVECNLYAPAGHAVKVDVRLEGDVDLPGLDYAVVKEVKKLFLPTTIDGLIYLVDGSLQRRLQDSPNCLDFEKLMKSFSEYISRIDKSSRTLKEEPHLAFVFKGEGLYAQIRSFLMMDKALHLWDVPTIGVRTHMGRDYISDSTYVKEFQTLLNENLVKYERNIKDVSAKYPGIQQLRKKVKEGYLPLNQLDFFYSTDDWRNMDLLKEDQRTAVVQLFYDICVRTLQSKGINPEGFRLVSFSNSPVFGDMVVNYKELKI